MSALLKSNILISPTDVLPQYFDLLEYMSTPAVFFQYLQNSEPEQETNLYLLLIRFIFILPN